MRRNLPSRPVCFPRRRKLSGVPGAVGVDISGIPGGVSEIFGVLDSSKRCTLRMAIQKDLSLCAAPETQPARSPGALPEASRSRFLAHLARLLLRVAEAASAFPGHGAKSRRALALAITSQ